MIFEGTTGRKETELRYHGSRPYGWFGLADVDADGQRELVTIGDFQSHIDVLEFDPARPETERLSVKWRRDIEQNIEEREKWPQVGPHPLADVNGDGRPELVLNLFNDTGDGQWHAVVLDATDGKTLWDLPRRFVQVGATSTATGRRNCSRRRPTANWCHTCGTIELVGVQERRRSFVGRMQNAAWCSADLPRFGPTWSTTASQGMQHVLLRGSERPTFFVKTWEAGESRQVTLAAMRCQSDRRVETLGASKTSRTDAKRSRWTATPLKRRRRRWSASDWPPTKRSRWPGGTCGRELSRTGRWASMSRCRSRLRLAPAKGSP